MCKEFVEKQLEMAAKQAVEDNNKVLTHEEVHALAKEMGVPQSEVDDFIDNRPPWIAGTRGNYATEFARWLKAVEEDKNRELTRDEVTALFIEKGLPVAEADIAFTAQQESGTRGTRKNWEEVIEKIQKARTTIATRERAVEIAASYGVSKEVAEMAFDTKPAHIEGTEEHFIVYFGKLVQNPMFGLIEMMEQIGVSLRPAQA
jgi:hypothetical protein